MEIVVEINSVDKTNYITVDTIRKEDGINDKGDLLTFVMNKYTTDTYEPEINDEVVLTIDSVKEFGGVITNIDQTLKGGTLVEYKIECSDYTQYLNRRLVLERYDNKTINYIINDLLTRYASDFTDTNVDADITIKTVIFNRENLSSCLSKLAGAVNYSWYVDYDKDIHFFSRSKNPAPYSVTDSNGKYINGTLAITKDLSQIRNKVYIRGSEEEGNERTENYTVLDDRLTYNLANKFAKKPTVTVDSVEIDVGLDYISPEDDFDAFWNFNEKYIRFKVAPDLNDEIVVTGIPLFPILVCVQNSSSIAEFGVYEYFKEDKTVKSREEAIQLAQAEIEAYKNGINEGYFLTDKTGLRSGQIITIQSDYLNINESFLIQKVDLWVKTKTKAEWSVGVASMRTIGIIEVLQMLLKKDVSADKLDNEGLLTLLQFSDTMSIEDSYTVKAKTSPPYKWEGSTPEPSKLVWNFGTWTA